MQTQTQIRQILETHGLAPKKSLGQNFLLDHNLIRKLVDSASVSAGELILEVGPGTGTLTEELLARGASVIACELDDGLASHLRDHFASFGERFTLVHGDCLESKRELSRAAVAAIASRPFKLVANLPYGAGTPVMLALLANHPACSTLAVTIQREVADRLLASPGTDDYGTISVVAQAAANVQRVATLPPECFWPRPDVTSAMVVLHRRETPLTSDLSSLADTCQKLFMGRRKQLGSVVSGVLGRERAATFAWPAEISPTARAESLSVPQLVSLDLALGLAERG